MNMDECIFSEYIFMKKRVWLKVKSYRIFFHCKKQPWDLALKGSLLVFEKKKSGKYKRFLIKA